MGFRLPSTKSSRAGSFSITPRARFALGVAGVVYLGLCYGTLHQEQVVEGQNLERIAEQSRPNIKGFKSVVGMQHEQLLVPGDKDRATIELTGGTTCHVVLRMPGILPTHPDIANWGDCPVLS